MADLPPLAQFLRSRREALTPERAGLVGGGRRRTPGLRREELATLATVSIDYLIRLEQGRDTNPSPEVLAALGSALQLSPEEMRRLHALAAVGSSPALQQSCPAPPALDADVPDSVRFVLDQIDPTAAFVVGPLGDVVASNRSWDALAEPIGLLEVPNLIRHVFLHPDAHQLYPDWEAVADGEVVRLRSTHLELESDPRFVALLEELSAVPDFAERWRAHPIARPVRSELLLDHPEFGSLRITQEAMTLASDDQQLICWVPADAATEAAVRRAAQGDPSATGHLRLVGGE